MFRGKESLCKPSGFLVIKYLFQKYEFMREVLDIGFMFQFKEENRKDKFCGCCIIKREC